MAGDSSSDVAAAGRRTVETLYEAFNTAVPEAVQACFHFPLVVAAGDAPVVVATPAEFGPDFDALRRSERWQRTSLDRLDVVGTSPSRAYCLVELSRYDADGRRYLAGTSLYTVALVGGSWGIQVISADLHPVE
jgi:hypothetical protein